MHHIQKSSFLQATLKKKLLIWVTWVSLLRNQPSKVFGLFSFFIWGVKDTESLSWIMFGVLREYSIFSHLRDSLGVVKIFGINWIRKSKWFFQIFRVILGILCEIWVFFKFISKFTRVTLTKNPKIFEWLASYVYWLEWKQFLKRFKTHLGVKIISWYQ